MRLSIRAASRQSGAVSEPAPYLCSSLSFRDAAVSNRFHRFLNFRAAVAPPDPAALFLRVLFRSPIRAIPPLRSGVFRFLGCVAHMLFRELFDIFHEVDIAHDLEIETPRVVHASLPEIAGFIVLLRVERWVMQILDQKRRLLV